MLSFIGIFCAELLAGRCETEGEGGVDEWWRNVSIHGMAEFGREAEEVGEGHAGMMRWVVVVIVMMGSGRLGGMGGFEWLVGCL